MCLIVCDLEAPKRQKLGQIWAVAPMEKKNENRLCLKMLQIAVKFELKSNET